MCPQFEKDFHIDNQSGNMAQALALTPAEWQKTLAQLRQLSSDQQRLEWTQAQIGNRDIQNVLKELAPNPTQAIEEFWLWRLYFKQSKEQNEIIWYRQFSLHQTPLSTAPIMTKNDMFRFIQVGGKLKVVVLTNQFPNQFLQSYPTSVLACEPQIPNQKFQDLLLQTSPFELVSAEVEASGFSRPRLDIVLRKERFSIKAFAFVQFSDMLDLEPEDFISSAPALASNYTNALAGIPRGFNRFKMEEAEKLANTFFKVNLVNDPLNYYVNYKGQPPPKLNPNDLFTTLLKASELCKSTVMYSPQISWYNGKSSAAWIIVNPQLKRVVFNLITPKSAPNQPPVNSWKSLHQLPNLEIQVGDLARPEQVVSSQNWFKIYAQPSKSGKVLFELRTDIRIADDGTAYQNSATVGHETVSFRTLLLAMPRVGIPLFGPGGWSCSLPDPFTKAVQSPESANTVFILNPKQHFCYDRASLLSFLGQEAPVKFPLPSGDTYILVSTRNLVQYFAATQNLLGFYIKHLTVEQIELNPIFATWDNCILNKKIIL